MENSMDAPQKLKIELPYDPLILFLGIYPKKTKTLIQKDTWTPMFTAALFTIAKTWKQPECSSAGWALLDKEDVVYMYTMKYCSVFKKEWNSATNNVDGPRGYYA